MLSPREGIIFRMAKLGLDYLSVFGQEPVAFIHLARELGLSSVGLNLRGAANSLSRASDMGFGHSPERRRAITQALRDTGMTLALVEGFSVASGSSAADIARDLDHLAEMGTLSVCFVSVDKDRMRTQAQFRQLAELAVDREIVITTEVGAGVVRNLQAALDLAAAVDHSHFGLLIDTMHFFRSGATIADFAAIDPVLVRHVQICDVPMPALIENYMEEALFERRAPGDGDLPLVELVGHIPAHTTIGLEIPMRSEAERGLSHRQRLDRCVKKARALWMSDSDRE
jgi:sugar phosphate isomerase/epimerase